MSKTAHQLAEWQKYLFPEEVDCLQCLAKRFHIPGGESPVFVNIGAGAGTSTFALLEGCPTAVVFSVDIRADEAPTMTNEHLRVKEALEDGKEFPKRIIRIWGDSKLVGQAFPYKVDLIFVDGDHSYEGCKGDTDAWTDCLNEGGIMAFHDYGKKPTDGSIQWPGVQQAVDEWVAKVNPRLLKNVMMIRAYEV